MCFPLSLPCPYAAGNLWHRKSQRCIWLCVIRKGLKASEKQILGMVQMSPQGEGSTKVRHVGHKKERSLKLVQVRGPALRWDLLTLWSLEASLSLLLSWSCGLAFLKLRIHSLLHN